MISPKSSDLRIKILNKLIQENRSSGEFIANEFLHELHSDLGTIRRALIDLVQSDLIFISNISDKEKAIEWIYDKIITSYSDDAITINSKKLTENDIKDVKSSKRLVQKIGKEDKIVPIRLLITINGVKYLIDFDNSVRTNWTIRNQIWVSIGLLLIGAIIGYLIDFFKVSNCC